MFGLAKYPNLFLLGIWLVESSEGLAQRASNSGYGLFTSNATKPVIFINNPDLLHVKHSQSADEGLTLANTNIEQAHQLIGGVPIEESSKTLGLYLRGVSNQELGVPVLQSVFDQLPYISFLRNDTNTAMEIANRIKSKMSVYIDLVSKIKTAVEMQYFRIHPQNPVPDLPNCCSIPPVQLKFDRNFGVPVNKDFSCNVAGSGDRSVGSFSNLTSVFAGNLGRNPSIKWQYLITLDGVELEHPSSRRGSRMGQPCSLVGRHRQVLMSTLHPNVKRIIIILDRGSLVTSSQLEMGTEAINFVLETLSVKDFVAIVLVGEEAGVVKVEEECGVDSLVMANKKVVDKMRSYVGRILQDNKPADHKAGFIKAFQIIANSQLLPEDNVQILFVTSGLLNSLSDSKSIMRTLSSLRQKTKQTVVISSLGLLSRNRDQLLFSSTYLQDIASQNFNKYNLSSISSIVPGHYITVNSSSTIGQVLGNYYVSEESTTHNAPLIHPPSRDTVGGGVIVSVSQVSEIMEKTIGVVGVDIHLADITEDIFHRPREEDSYVFLMDKETGAALAHPSIKPPEDQDEPSTPHIAKLESVEGFATALQMMMSSSSGSHTVLGNVTYTWHQAQHTPYTVVVVSQGGTPRPPGSRLGHVLNLPDTGSVQYHRLDLSGGAKLCRHFREIASMQSGTLYLSPSAFASPFEHTQEDASPLRTQSFMAYLTDPTRLIANPGLRSGVRSDVAAVVRVTDQWREHAYSSPLNNYIVRRRVATPRGVQLSYPGTPVPRGTDPTAAPWYHAAVALPGRLVVSPPHLDPGGAGYVVTVSQTVYAGNAQGEHSPDDGVAAVVSADLTMGYFYKIVNDTMPGDICGVDSIRCFLMDDQGYLVAHPHLARGYSKGWRSSAEAQHIIHREPLVASDILNHDGFMVKKLCRSESDENLQRFFQLNIGEEGVVTNLAAGEHCSRYQVVTVPGTNLFLGLVNQTCQDTAFCPCSTVDRTCLNCRRMEQRECECPCECSSVPESCPGASSGETVKPIVSCPVTPLPAKPARFTTTRLTSLPPCIHTDCQSRDTEADCFGVLGCSWCHLDQDGFTHLNKPFCSYQETCFSGILSSLSPYSRLYDRTEMSVESDPERGLFRASPIGPVAGGIMAFFILLALTAWGYRHWTTGERRMLGGGGSTLRMDRLEEEPATEDQNKGGHDGHQNYALHEVGAGGGITVVSPYRMNPTYRRPRPAPGTDSDHGYSTMTPYGDQDSEIMSCLGEPVPSVGHGLQGRRDRFRSRAPLSLQSVTSGVSSRTASPQPQGAEGGMDKMDMEGEGGGGPVRGTMSNKVEGETLLSGCDDVPGMTILNKNQMIVSAMVHIVDTQ